MGEGGHSHTRARHEALQVGMQAQAEVGPNVSFPSLGISCSTRHMLGCQLHAVEHMNTWSKEGINEGMEQAVPWLCTWLAPCFLGTRHNL